MIVTYLLFVIHLFIKIIKNILNYVKIINKKLISN